MHRTHRHLDRTVGKRVSRCALDAEQSNDIATRRGFDLFHRIRVHSNQASHFVLAPTPTVENVHPSLKRSLVDPKVRELSVPTVFELERKGHQRLVRIAVQPDGRFIVRNVNGAVFDVRRRRQVPIDGVQKLLNSLVLVRGAQENRRQLHGKRTGTDGIVNQVFGDVFLENGLHQVIGKHRYRIQHRLTRNLGLGKKLAGNFLLDDVLSPVTFEVDRLHRDQVDHSFKVGFETNRQLHHDGVVPKLFSKLVRDSARVRTRPVELVDKSEARNAVASHLAVYGHRLRLHAGHTAEHQHGAIEHAKSAFDLDREVHVPRRIDDVDVVIRPDGVRRGRLDRDAALPFQLHGVHRRADGILALDLVHRMNASGVEEDPLG